jgi:hypothetical protein
LKTEARPTYNEDVCVLERRHRRGLSRPCTCDNHCNKAVTIRKKKLCTFWSLILEHWLLHLLWWTPTWNTFKLVKNINQIRN